MDQEDVGIAGPHRNQDTTAPTEKGQIGETEREILLGMALDSIHHGLRTGEPLEPDLERFDEVLKAPGAVFVTLNLHGNLRGCVGSFEASRPLVQDVARNAY